MNGFSLDHLLAGAVLTGARVAGLMVFCPFLGGSDTPTPLKASLTLLLTMLLYPLRGPVALALGGWQWGAVMMKEVVIGLMLGLSASFLMEAAMFAGQMLGVQMGYSLAVVFDPQTQADTPVLSQFHRLAALLIFLQCNVHHWLLRAVARSFAYLPASPAPVGLAGTEGLLRSAAGIFFAGAQIAAPSLVATLVADAALGFLGKASPQLPILFIGLSVKNLLGLAMLIGVIAYWPESFAERFAQAVGLGERLLHLAH